MLTFLPAAAFTISEAEQWLEKPLFTGFGIKFTTAALLAFAGCFFAGIILARILRSERVTRWLTRLGLDKRFVAIAQTVLALLVVIAGIFAGLNAAGVGISWESPLPGIHLSLGQLMRLALLMVVAFWASSAFKRLLFDRVFNQPGFDRSLQYALAQIGGYIVLITGAFLALDNCGINLSALTFWAGAVGVGVGFGLQNITSNFISGLVILAERPIKVGDRVEVEGKAGLVQAIRARSTTIVTNDNISLIVPNSKFIESTVTNWSHGDRRVRFLVPIGVAYGSDVERVVEALLSVAKAHPEVLTEPPPNVFFAEFGDSSLNFNLVVWTDTMSDRPKRFLSDLNFGIEKALRLAGIEIPFPQRDLHLRTNQLQVSLDPPLEKPEKS